MEDGDLRLGHPRGPSSGRTQTAPVCVLVLGMHRSGTSAITRVISLAGAALPKDLMGATRGNELGHWEPAALVARHDDLLAELGSRWDDWLALDVSKLDSRRKAEWRADVGELLAAQYGSAPLLVVKDPRICRFAGFFMSAVEQSGMRAVCLLALRSPLDVVNSLVRRDSMARSRAALLWLRHTLDAEHASRTHPRAIVGFDSLLSDWRSTFDRMNAHLGIDWRYTADEIGPQVEAFLNAEMRHHKSRPEDVLLDPMLRDWIGDVYSAMLILEQSPNSQAALESLDKVRGEFDAAAPIISRILAETHENFEQVEAGYRASLDDAQQKLGQLYGMYDVAQAKIADLHGALSVTQSALDAERAALERQAAERRSQAEDAERMQAALSRSESELAILRAQAKAASDVMAAVRVEGEKLRAEKEKLRAELADARSRAATEGERWRAWLDAAQQESQRLRALVAQRDEHLHAMGSSTSWRLTRPLRGVKRLFSEPEFRRQLPYRLARSAVRRLNIPVLYRAKAKAWAAKLGLIYTGAPTAFAPTPPPLSAPQGVTAPSARAARPDGVRYRILYVVNDSDLQTQKYRVLNYAKELARHTVQSTIVREAELHGVDPAQFDLIVFNRVAASDQTRALLTRCKALGTPTRYDVDDLVFDVERLSLLRFLQAISADEQKLFAGGVASRRELMLMCDLVTTSTAQLAHEVEKLGKPAFVLPNTIGREDRETFGNLRRPQHSASGGRVRIGYFSGTKTHQHDFSCCAGALVSVLRDNPNTELFVVGELELPQTFDGLRDRIVTRPLMTHQDMLRELASVDINLCPLELGNAFTACKSELKVFEAALFGIPTIASPTPPMAAIIQNGENGMLAADAAQWRNALETLVSDAKIRHQVGERAKEHFVARFSIETAVEEALALDEAMLARRTPQIAARADAETKGRTDVPLVSVVAILHNKRNEVRFFLESLRRQDFEGAFEVLLVNDCTRDDSVAVAEDFYRQMRAGQVDAPAMTLRILNNETNLGNCASRNRAIAEAKGEVIVIVDADCMLNRSYLREHYRAHAHGDCDAAIGPMNIETNQRPPLAVLGAYEADAELRRVNAALQDEVNTSSFVNCVTRNFSIGRRFLTGRLDGELFDNLFGYSRDPQSGFGWEDVEMGCRLYKAGASIRFLPDTFSIHVSHPSTTEERTKPLRSLKNFRRLHEKHPDLILLARQWSIATHEAIRGWVKQSGLELKDNADARYLDGVFTRYARAPVVIQRNKKLRVLTHRWHCPHQYELYRAGHDFTLVTGAGTGLCDSWDWEKRPMPSNARFLHRDEINARDYDLAIVHFDENVLHPERCHGKVPMDWGATLNWFLRETGLPKIGVCHGTPQFAGQYDGSYAKDDLGRVNESSRRELVEHLRDVLVVCNSHQSRQEWRFHRSRTIWHGFAPHEYPEIDHNGRVLTMLGAALNNRPHYNGHFVVQRIQEILGADSVSALKVDEPPASYTKNTRAWAESRFDNYTRAVGRFSVYLNPTLRSPMPRSRGEAMMLGLASVSMRNHDVDMFIRNGENGFFGDSPEELAEQLAFLQRNSRAAERIGAASRRTALDLFNQDLYLAEWSKLLSEVTG
ncbi:MAG: glycosyltransferase [Hyphomonadaceae bacterium]|nr:glycosyltransferase [Hyphomonadaceae bacterium]